MNQATFTDWPNPATTQTPEDAGEELAALRARLDHLETIVDACAVRLAAVKARIEGVSEGVSEAVKRIEAVSEAVKRIEAVSEAVKRIEAVSEGVKLTLLLR